MAQDYNRRIFVLALMFGAVATITVIWTLFA